MLKFDIKTWYKQDLDVQGALIKLAKGNLIISSASFHVLSKVDSIPQQRAKRIFTNVNDSINPSVSALYTQSLLFRCLCNALAVTASGNGMTDRDVCNIQTDVSLLISYFGSTQTVKKIRHLYKVSHNSYLRSV